MMRVLACLLFLGAAVGCGQTIRITSPASGLVVRPGGLIKVSVSASGFSSVFLVAGNLGTLGPLSTAPYEFSFWVATEAMQQRYEILAVGVVAPEKFVTSTPVGIIVQRPDSPISLLVMPSPLGLEVGETAGIGVLGTYRDGSTGDLTYAANTIYTAMDPSIATVSTEGRVKAVAPGLTTILVNGSVRVPVTVIRRKGSSRPPAAASK